MEYGGDLRQTDEINRSIRRTRTRQQIGPDVDVSGRRHTRLLVIIADNDSTFGDFNVWTMERVIIDPLFEMRFDSIELNVT